MDKQTESALKLWVVMNRASRSIASRLRHQVERHGLTFTEFAVLEVLLHKGTLPAGEVGDRVLLTSGSMTYVLDKLQKNELIRRKPCPDDRRVVHVELTDSGRRLIEKVFPEHADLIRELFSVLQSNEQQQMTDQLKSVGYAAEAIST